MTTDPFVLYSKGPASVTIGPSLVFDAMVDFKLSISGQTVREMAIRWKGGMHTQLAAEVALTSSGNVRFEQAVYAKTLVPILFWIGYVPFWLQPFLNVKASIVLKAGDSMKFQSNVALQSSLTMQAQWTPANRNQDGGRLLQDTRCNNTYICFA